MEAISAHPFPVVAAINGHCLGGGLELAVRCDLRVCAASAKLGMPPAKLGLIYGHTGLERFIQVIGVARTKELFLTGRDVSAERALRIGLVNRVAADEELADAALALAAEIAGNAPLSLKGNKRVIEELRASEAGTRSGAGAGRAAPLVLHLGGLPRGSHGFCGEAKARLAWSLRRTTGTPEPEGSIDR